MRDMEGSDAEGHPGPAAELRFGTGGAGRPGSYRYIEDGIVVVRDGRIEAVGEAPTCWPTLPPGTPVDHHPDGLIAPGLHRHPYPFSADAGDRVLWRAAAGVAEASTPSSRSSASPMRRHAERTSVFFMDELLRNGTTTAVVYAPCIRGRSRPSSRNPSGAEPRMIAGKVMMDRNAPPGLRDTPQSGLSTKAGR